MIYKIMNANEIYINTKYRNFKVQAVTTIIIIFFLDNNIIVKKRKRKRRHMNIIIY
jgi:hypothetical protein